MRGIVASLLAVLLLVSCSGGITPPDTSVPAGDDGKLVHFADFKVALEDDEACIGFTDGDGKAVQFPFEAEWTDGDGDGFLDPEDYGLVPTVVPLDSLGYVVADGRISVDPSIVSSNATSLLSGNAIEALKEILSENVPALEYLMLPDGLTSIGGGILDDTMRIYMIFISEPVYKGFLEVLQETGLFVLNGTKELVIPASMQSVTPIFLAGAQECRYAVRDGNASYSAEDGFLLSRDGTRLVAGHLASSLPESVEEVAPVSMVGLADGDMRLEGLSRIGEYAFALSSGLESLELEGVVSVGEGAFLSCPSLADLTLGEGLVDIGDYAFKAAFSLSDIDFPVSLESLGSGAFAGWAVLGDSSNPDGVTNYKARSVSFAPGSRLESFGSMPFEMTPVVDITLTTDHLAQWWQPMFRWHEKADEVGADGIHITFADGVETVRRLPEDLEGFEFTRSQYEDNYETLVSVELGPSVKAVEPDAFTCFFESADWTGSPGVECLVTVHDASLAEGFPWTGGNSCEGMDVTLNLQM